jgi:hypothetical protein
LDYSGRFLSGSSNGCADSEVGGKSGCGQKKGQKKAAAHGHILFLLPKGV